MIWAPSKERAEPVAQPPTSSLEVRSAGFVLGESERR
jgi:hypothetical protein